MISESPKREAGQTGTGSRRTATLIFFGVLLALGLGIFRDYGISWDESIQRAYGGMVYNYITTGDQEVLSDRHRHYGAVFQVLLYSLEKSLGLEDSRQIYLMRHLAS
jgi:hypothetical protein